MALYQRHVTLQDEKAHMHFLTLEHNEISRCLQACDFGNFQVHALET